MAKNFKIFGLQKKFYNRFYQNLLFSTLSVNIIIEHQKFHKTFYIPQKNYVE